MHKQMCGIEAFGVSNSTAHNTLAIAEYLISYVNERHSQLHLFESLVHKLVLIYNPLHHWCAQTKINTIQSTTRNFMGKELCPPPKFA